MVSLVVLVCGMSAGIVGCTKDPNTNDRDVRVAKNVKFQNDAKIEKEVTAKGTGAQELARTEFTLKDLFPQKPRAKEFGRTELPAADPDTKQPDPDELGGKQVAALEPSPVQVVAAKPKEKTKPKEPAKESTKEPSKEPKFEFKEPTEVAGKTFQEWMKLMKSTDPVRREEAMKYVIAFGPLKSPEALPEVILQLNRHKTAPAGVDLSVRVNGIIALSTIYQHMAMTKKEPSEKLHKEAFALFKYYLKDGQVIMKVRTVQGLPNLGPIARDAIEDVIVLTRDPITWEVRKEALQTLTRIARDASGTPHTKVMPELRTRAINRDAEPAYIVRQTALEGIAMLKAPDVPPEVFNALDNDPAVQVRLKALELVYKLSGEEMKPNDRTLAIKKLNAHLPVEKDPILLIWTHVDIMTLRKKIDPAHLNPIISYVKHSDLPVRVQAMTTIGMAGEKAKPMVLKVVLDELNKCVPNGKEKKWEYPEPNLAVAAMKAAVGIHAFDEAIPILEKIENDKQAPEWLKSSAAKALDAFDDLKMHLEGKDKKDKDKKTSEKK
jgi:hypothetical protein